jgi:hypothetical protein
LRKRRLWQRSSTCRKAPHFALHKGIAIGFLKATGFRNKTKRTIFYFWCGDPDYVSLNGLLLIFSDLILEAKVDPGIASFAAAPDGP